MQINKRKIPKVLKPHGTASWLIINYPHLTVEQIAIFCEMDHLKVLFLKNRFYLISIFLWFSILQFR